MPRIIEDQLLDRLISDLSKLPYRNVAGPIAALASLPKVTEIPTESTPHIDAIVTDNIPPVVQEPTDTGNTGGTEPEIDEPKSE